MYNKTNMQVVKRDGTSEEVSFDKITSRIKALCNGLDRVKVHTISLKTINNIYEGISTSELDTISANICATLAATDYQYNQLGGRILVSSAEKNIRVKMGDNDSFVGRMNNIQTEYNKRNGRDYLVPEMVKYMNDNADVINKIIDYSKDFNFEFFGYKTLEKSYLVKFDEKVVESPQDLYLRVAVSIHFKQNNVELMKKTYEYLSENYFTHATPTLFNAGVINGQYASCFLLGTEDSIEGMYDTVKDCAMISRGAGGIGVHISNIRANNSIIKGSNGRSNGIVRFMKVLNETSKHVTQGGKRAGSFAVYLEPWHADVKDFLELKKATGADSERTRDLFLALWIPDLFMKAVQLDNDWYLMSPDECPNLNEVFGKEFEDLYNKYVSEGKFREKVKATDIWNRILDSQIETGVPYILFKDRVNERSNQKNIDIVKSSNLCVAPETEILTDKGYQIISELKDKFINVWNGFEFSNVQVKQTGVNQKLILVETSDGNHLFCTPQHKFYIQSEEYHVKKPTIIEAQHLKEGLKLMKCEYPVIREGLDTFKYPYCSGLFTADGTYYVSKKYAPERKCSFKRSEDTIYCSRHQNYYQLDELITENHEDGLCSAIISKKPKISLYDEKKKLADYLEIRPDTEIHENNNRIDVNLPLDLPEKYSVPIDQNIDIRLKWFAGFIDGDGTIAVNGTNKQLQLASIHKDFLIKINRMLNTMGVNGKINIGHKAGKRLMPDGKGGNKLFDCQTGYRLLLTSCDLYKLNELGLNCHRLDFHNMEEPQRDAKQFVKIIKVSDQDDIDDTYCFTESKRHTGIFNGIITGQCAEITQVSNSSVHSVCNLASIAVNKFYQDGKYNFDKLKQVSKLATINLNRVIDVNAYPTEGAKKTNLDHRPIGVGIQGVADLLAMMKIPYETDEALLMEGKVMETIYYGCIEASCELAVEEGSYSMFEGSDFQKGIFQFDYDERSKRIIDNQMYVNDWNALKEKVKANGMRNSLLTALMPTASTSNILGNNECFEWFTNNIYTRSTQAGTFTIVNKYLVDDLIKLKLWDSDMKEKIIINQGSIQNIDEIPQDLRDLYKTIWEIKQKAVIDHAAARSHFVDQSQSMNLFLAEPDTQKLSSALIYGWRNKLKTGCYYYRGRAGTSAQKFTIDPTKEKEMREKEKDKKKNVNCKEDENDGVCVMCSG
jgi:ribonucleoside-diphosphate reductase alpha chain